MQITEQSRTEIVLATINSTYQHTAFGLRYLQSNLAELEPRSIVKEFTLEKAPELIASELLSLEPKIIGLGIYIWNAEQSLELVKILKARAPQVVIVIGGPEVSYESEKQEIVHRADYLIQGEADFQFRDLCRELLSADSQLEAEPASTLKQQKIIPAKLPEIKNLESPYRLYSDNDIKSRYIYVEVSRGCPYRCEYCLSSLDKSVRSFDLEIFLGEMDHLISRGARQFKFIDRTFNLSPSTSTKILRFFLDRIHLNLFLHFEMVPDRLPQELRELITQFPQGSLQFEIGIQTFNPEVAKNVSRKNDLVKVRENFEFLRTKTGVHTHADLIVGLPGENLSSFGQGFDELVRLGPQEIQVGILKRLKGTPIVRHEKTFQLNYSTKAPYQILSTKDVSAYEIQLMVRFAKYWDLISNSGQFPRTSSFLKNQASAFQEFSQLTDFLYHRLGRIHGVPLLKYAELLFEYLKCVHQLSEDKAREILFFDYCQMGSRTPPHFLRSPKIKTSFQEVSNHNLNLAIPPRQRRHLQGAQKNHGVD